MLLWGRTLCQKLTEDSGLANDIKHAAKAPLFGVLSMCLPGEEWEIVSGISDSMNGSPEPRMGAGDDRSNEEVDWKEHME